MTPSFDEVLLQQNISLDRIRDMAIRISESLEKMNLISESDAMNALVTSIDESIYTEMSGHLGRDYFGNQSDYIMCYALLKRIAITDQNQMEDIIARVIM